MRLRNWVTLAGVAAGVGIVAKSFLPQRFALDTWDDEPLKLTETNAQESPEVLDLPDVEVTFLRCGTASVPQWVAVRGGLLAPVDIAHSAVLVRHPKATFLYDTGLCTDVHAYLANQSFLFRKTLANFVFEQSLSSHLKSLGLERGTIDFALLSHLHWDHVSAIPAIPGVPLRVNRVEYEAARLGLLDAYHGLTRHLMGDNPLELFDCAGPAYEGYRSSYDLFGDGSVVLVPLPGHTAGNTGMFINRANGPRVFLLGDAAWVSQNYLRPATMHPFMWSRITSDDATARQTLIKLHHFALQHPEIILVAMHDAEMQEKFLILEQAQITGARMKQ